MASMYKVRLEGKKAFVTCYGDKVPQEELIDSLRPYLGSVMEISPGTTFGDLWSYLECDLDFFSDVFFDQLGGRKLHPFVEHSRLPASEPKEKDEHGGIDYLEVSWASESHIFEGKKEVYVLADFGGMGTDGEGRECGWGIDFLTLSDLLHFPLKLNTNLEIQTANLDDKTAPYGTPKYELGKRDFTVYDVFSGIFDEISFFGYPQNGKAAKTLAEIDQIRSGIENGEVELIDADDVFDELRREKEEKSGDDDK